MSLAIRKPGLNARGDLATTGYHMTKVIMSLANFQLDEAAFKEKVAAAMSIESTFD